MNAFRISTEPIYGNFKDRKGPKKKKKNREIKPREGNEKDYLVFIRLLPCCACPAPAPSEAHHLKSGTGERGAGMRSTDKWAVPLCHECHINGVERVGSRNETSWFEERGIDPLELARGLWSNKQDIAAMLKVLITHKSEAGQ